MRALLIGEKPGCDLGYTYESTPPYDGVVIGSLTLGQALCFANEPVLSALAEGKPVVCYTPGFPQAAKNRALGAALASARRNMKNLGIVFTDGEAPMPKEPLNAIWMVYGEEEIAPPGGTVIRISPEQLERLRKKPEKQG